MALESPDVPLSDVPASRPFHPGWVAISLLAPVVGAGTVLLAFFHQLPLPPNGELYVGMFGMLLAVVVGLFVVGYCWHFQKSRWVWIVLITHVVGAIAGVLYLTAFMLEM